MLGFQERPTLWVGCSPLPDNVSVPGEFVALLTKETLPAELPAVCGANVTVNGMLCPAGTVSGKVIPPTEKPAPVQLAEETVMPELPAVSDPVCFWLLPKTTLPKLIADGLTLSCPDATPVPASVSVIAVVPLSETEMLPLAAPATAGSKPTVTVELCPAESTRGNDGMETTLNPEPEAAI